MLDRIDNIAKLIADYFKIISVVKGRMEIGKLKEALYGVGDWCITYDAQCI